MYIYIYMGHIDRASSTHFVALVLLRVLSLCNCTSRSVRCFLTRVGLVVLGDARDSSSKGESSTFLSPLYPESFLVPFSRSNGVALPPHVLNRCFQYRAIRYRCCCKGLQSFTVTWYVVHVLFFTSLFDAQLWSRFFHFHCLCAHLDSSSAVLAGAEWLSCLDGISVGISVMPTSCTLCWYGIVSFIVAGCWRLAPYVTTLVQDCLYVSPGCVPVCLLCGQSWLKWPCSLQP